MDNDILSVPNLVAELVGARKLLRKYGDAEEGVEASAELEAAVARIDAIACAHCAPACLCGRGESCAKCSTVEVTDEQ